MLTILICIIYITLSSTQGHLLWVRVWELSRDIEENDGIQNSHLEAKGKQCQVVLRADWGWSWGFFTGASPHDSVGSSHWVSPPSLQPGCKADCGIDQSECSRRAWISRGKVSGRVSSSARERGQQFVTFGSRLNSPCVWDAVRMHRWWSPSTTVLTALNLSRFQWGGRGYAAIWLRFTGQPHCTQGAVTVTVAVVSWESPVKMWEAGRGDEEMSAGCLGGVWPLQAEARCQ